MRTTIRFAFMVLFASALTGAVRADVLVDQLGIVDTFAYDQGVIASTIGGWSLTGGDNYDSQVVDDFTVPAPGYTITDVWFDYFCFLGGGSPPKSLIEIFPDVSGRPGEIAIAHVIVTGTAASAWTPIFLGLKGERHHASGLSIMLPAGHYWISMQPITMQSWGGNGDIYYPVQDTDVPPVGQTYFREPGIDPDVNHEGSLGFGPLLFARAVPDFITTEEEGIEAGDSSFKVEGVVLMPLVGDCDDDGDVDQVDFIGLYECLLGPEGGLDAACDCFDLDVSGEVDLQDVAAFERLFLN